MLKFKSTKKKIPKVPAIIEPTPILHEEEVIEINPFEALIPSNFAKKLEEKGIIFVNSPITHDSLEGPSQQLLALHYDETWPDDKEVQIIINSPGGYCSAGFAFIDIMNFVRFPVRTIAIGEVASMGTMIFINGDERVMSDNCQLMIHHFSAVNYGNYADLMANRKNEDDLYRIFIKNLIANSKYKTEADVKKNILSDKDMWFTADEAVKHGLADKVAKQRSKKRPKATKRKKR